VYRVPQKLQTPIDQPEDVPVPRENSFVAVGANAWPKNPKLQNVPKTDVQDSFVLFVKRSIDFAISIPIKGMILN
jgi:hypothetical protein